jgi:hypothetical protein
MFVGCYWTQLSLYWILGATSQDVKESARAGGMFRAAETAGQAISYGLSSASSIPVTVPLYVHCGVWVLMVPSMVLLIRSMPEAISMHDEAIGKEDDVEQVSQFAASKAS